ncbi:MAG TPA: histidine kinase [Pyrinomonadaceae bacterium]|nr:histidine kinase [Pyrinomonadaceae bacterium]
MSEIATPSTSLVPTSDTKLMENSVPNGEEQSVLSRWWVRYGLIWGIWTLVAVFFCTQVYVMSYTQKEPVRYLRDFLFQASACYEWALATPLMLWLARRFRIERSNWVRRSLLHFLFSVVLTSTLVALHFIAFMILTGSASSITPLRVFNVLYYNLDHWVPVYWLILLMSHAFNYYNSFRKNELKASQLRTQLVQSQLEALKMQIHPHFLFNTLHSISALLSRDTEAARKMITRLGDFLRLTLENSGSMEVTLQQEIEFLNGYLEIERIRFQDRLTTDIRVDPEVLDVRVPNLILQPIVENAMRHAIGNSGSGRVEIVAAPRNGVVRIEVKDNGPGIDADRMLEARRGRGLGLANTRARLAGIYGEAARFELNNDPAGGLIVSLEIPRGSQI